jgi:hypothetical protein
MRLVEKISRNKHKIHQLVNLIKKIKHNLVVVITKPRCKYHEMQIFDCGNSLSNSNCVSLRYKFKDILQHN